MPRATRSEAEVNRQILEGLNKGMQNRRRNPEVDENYLAPVVKMLGLIAAVIMVYCAFTLPR